MEQYDAVAWPRVAFTKINGEVKWGSKFRKPMSNGLVFEVQLLGKPDDSQNGVYISVLNPQNPASHQFVLLPELINGQESCFIGIFAAGSDPTGNAEKLGSVLDRYRTTTHIFFTDSLDEAALEKVRDANLMLGYHGRDEKDYAAARAFLSKLHQVVAEFEILDYGIVNQDPATRNAAHIEHLSFSFQPSLR